MKVSSRPNPTLYQQGCRYGLRGSRPATCVTFSARGTFLALPELRDHALGLRDLVSSYLDLNLRPAHENKSP